MKKTPFAVRKYRDRNRPNLRWQATGPLIEGRRWRKFFATKPEAETYLESKKTEHENFGGRGLAMPETLRVMAQEAAEKLSPFGKSIRDAVDFYLPHLKATRNSVSVTALVEEFKTAKRHDGRSKRHLEDLKSRLQRFSTDFGDRLVATFTTREIDTWLRSLPVSAVSRNHARRVLHNVFEYAKRAAYCSENPISGTARAKETPGEIGILSVSECSRLLVAASELDIQTNGQLVSQSMLPYVAIGLFCGLRSAELERLEWHEVDLERRQVLVLGAKAKSAQRRVVEIFDNALEWLRPFASKAGPICPTDLRRRLAAVREKAKIAEWPHNALRHSFASYHLEAYGNAATTALALGHPNANLLFTNYRSLVRKEDAERFWKLRPDSEDATKVVAFRT